MVLFLYDTEIISKMIKIKIRHKHIYLIKISELTHIKIHMSLTVKNTTGLRIYAPLGTPDIII